MNDFEYRRVTTLDEITSLLQENGKNIKLLCGGTDLIPQLREERIKADLIIDIKEITELNKLEYTESGLFIGSTVTCLQARNDEKLKSIYPGLIDAFSIIGGIQIQGRATIGGNVCNSSPAADAIPALIAHNAVCEVLGNNKREVKLESFFTAPGKNVMTDSEFLVGLKLPPVGRGFGGSYMRFTPRNEMDIAVVGVGSCIQVNPETGIIESVRISLGAVAPTPLLVEAAGFAIVGTHYEDTLLEDKIEEAAIIAQKNCSPISDMRGSANQRRHLVKVLVKRTLISALERAKKNMEDQ